MTLDIYEVTLEMIEEIAPSARRLDRCDPDLARQLRRAAASVALNTAEGAYSQGKNAGARFYSAMASAQEVVACLDVARRFGYVAPIDHEVRDKLDRIIATLRKLTRRTVR